MNRHATIDARSLAFGNLIAAKLATDPKLVELGRANLRRWLVSCSPRARSTLQEWQEALDGPLDGVVTLLTSTDERSVRLRQSNPFAGALSTSERNEILLRFQSDETARA